jgi:P27 family predicted phage terminase small subunit
MPGPTPIAPHLQRLRGNPGKRKIRQPPQPPIPPQPPAPPDFLTGYAAEEWQRVAGELHRLRLLTALDVTILAVHCTAHARVRQVEELLAQDHEGRLPVNVLRQIARQSTATMIASARDLGLAPSSRRRLLGDLIC